MWFGGRGSPRVNVERRQGEERRSRSCGRTKLGGQEHTAMSTVQRKDISGLGL